MALQGHENRSGWYGRVHIYAPPTITTPPWATHERLSNVPARVFAECCNCWMPAEETVCTITGPLQIPLGMPNSEKLDWMDTVGGFYYSPYITIKCGPGCGCNINPRRRWGKHLRERW